MSKIILNLCSFFSFYIVLAFNFLLKCVSHNALLCQCRHYGQSCNFWTKSHAGVFLDAFIQNHTQLFSPLNWVVNVCLFFLFFKYWYDAMVFKQNWNQTIVQMISQNIEKCLELMRWQCEKWAVVYFDKEQLMAWNWVTASLSAFCDKFRLSECGPTKANLWTYDRVTSIQC